jgi:hypothetical protein
MKFSTNALTKICSPSSYIDTVKPSGKLNQMTEENKGVLPPGFFQKRTEIIFTNGSRVGVAEFGLFGRIRLFTQTTVETALLGCRSYQLAPALPTVPMMLIRDVIGFSRRTSRPNVAFCFMGKLLKWYQF